MENFNPQAPCGARPPYLVTFSNQSAFQSTGPLRGPTSALGYSQTWTIFQSTGPLRGPTYRPCVCRWPGLISIHRPLAGPDVFMIVYFTDRRIFQSTGPLRGPTRSVPIRLRAYRHFNPQAPCGARLRYHPDTIRLLEFQSTGPLRGPTCGKVVVHCISIFQSTGPLRGPTCKPTSICKLNCNFNPQAPCGARPSHAL